MSLSRSPIRSKQRGARVLAALILTTAIAIALSGCGSGATATTQPTAPVLTFSATTLTFASAYTGITSAAQTVTVTNTGGQSATIASISITGDFAQSSSGCTTLAVNASCQISVTFTATAVGSRTGILSLSSNATGSPQTVSLTGTGAAGNSQMMLSSTSLTFATTLIGTTTAGQTVTVTNNGSAALTISSITSAGDFSDVNNGCTVSLAVNATCQVMVTFTPTAAGARGGSVTLVSNALTNPQTITLSGTGELPVLVQAGTTPISGASVQLYAAGTAGNGSAPTALFGSPFTTSASGVALISSLPTCPSATAMVYLVSRGGTVSGATGANSNMVLMDAVGACGGLSTAAKFTIDEATTVAAAEALAPFYALGGAVGATATNLTGLTNAFATAATLADPTAGASPGSTLPGNAASPAPRMNSLANILNACAVSASACSTLYSATAQGSSYATNTLDAAYYLAKNPAQNVATLYAQSLTSTAYSPVLAAAPTDWTMFLTFSGAGMDSPSGIGVDSKGNVWVSSYFYTASKFTPIGAPVFASGITGDGLNNSYGLAIDLNDNVWIPNEQPFTAVGIGSVSELNSSGTSLAGNGYLNGGMNYPLSVAIDPNGTVWVVDYGDSYVTLLNSSGTPLSGTAGYTTPLFAFPVAVAIDANHFGWIANQSSDNLTKVAPDGSSFTNYDCCNSPSGIAIDQGDNIWAANYFGDSISLMTNSGTVISNSYTGLGSIYHPQGIAVDGAGTVWVANYRAPYLTELSGSTSPVPGTSLSPAAGLGGDAGLIEAYALALDASGNIWTSNQGSNTITKFIGLAVPVKTPLSGLPKLP